MTKILAWGRAVAAALTPVSTGFSPFFGQLFLTPDLIGDKAPGGARRHRGVRFGAGLAAALCVSALAGVAVAAPASAAVDEFAPPAAEAPRLPAKLTPLPRARDLQAEAARAARAGQPLVVLYSRRDCPWCEQVRREWLKPLADRQTDLVVRQVDQDSNAALRDFSGQATTHGTFAKARQVTLVPVVAFYGPDGRELTAAIVGVRLPDFYAAYLDESLKAARAALLAPPRR